MKINDYPKSLKEPDEIKARNKLLVQKHIAPLKKFVKEIREIKGEKYYIPYFDPLDGGIKAQCLFILEAPGAKTKNSGFISRNNNDDTARNFFEINQTAEIPMEKTITWNIIPWYLGDGSKIRPANMSDIKDGLVFLHKLIKLLPRLKVIVLVGRKAQKVENELSEIYNHLHIIKCYHPSPLVINRKPENKRLIINRLQQVHKYIR